MKKIMLLCLALISFGLTSVRVISGEILPDVTGTYNINRPPPLSLWNENYEASSLDSAVITNEVRRIAIIGGGGAGSITAILLSNLSKQARRYGLRFEITIFEKNNELIAGSAFEIAAVLHAGGCEYPEDIATIADCKEFGALFEQMFPGLYDNSLPIMYFTRTGSNLTSAMQQKAHKMAKKRGKNRGSLKSPKGKSSQHELSPKEVQGVFGLNISGGVRSTKDKSMKIFERNARIRKCIERDHEITVKTNACVSKIVKNADGTFCVMVGDKPADQVFHHICEVSWNNNQSITDASESSFDLAFTAEDRVIALCDISGVPHLQNTPFFTLQGGLMFMPISSELGLVYRCTEGGSYPEAGTIEIPPENTMKHGEKILKELKTAGFRHKGKNPFERVKLLGSKVLKIVKESGKPSHQRPHVPPVVTSEGAIIGTPTKATYIPWLALQIIEKFLEQLPDSSEFSNLQGFKETWLGTMHQLFPDNGRFCTEEKLPASFMISGAIEKEDIEDEKLKLFKNFMLTEAGKSYQRNLHCASPLRRRAASESLEILQSTCRTYSDSFVDRELSSPLNSSFDFMVSSSSSKIKLENPSGRSKQLRSPVSWCKDNEAYAASLVNGLKNNNADG